MERNKCQGQPTEKILELNWFSGDWVTTCSWPQGIQKLNPPFPSSRWKQKLSQGQIARVGTFEIFRMTQIVHSKTLRRRIDNFCVAEGQSYCSYSQLCDFSPPRKPFFFFITSWLDGCYKIHKQANWFHVPENFWFVQKLSVSMVACQWRVRWIKTVKRRW